MYLYVFQVDDDELEYESMIMGETCPEEDVIVDNCMLPKLEIGDWLVFEGKPCTTQRWFSSLIKCIENPIQVTYRDTVETLKVLDCHDFIL